MEHVHLKVGLISLHAPHSNLHKYAKHILQQSPVYLLPFSLTINLLKQELSFNWLLSGWPDVKISQFSHLVQSA